MESTKNGPRLLEPFHVKIRRQTMDYAGANTAQAEVMQTIDSWMKAIEARDLEGILSKYASNVVAFDAIQQLQFKGADAYGKHWQACFELCPGRSEERRVGKRGVTTCRSRGT